MTMQNYLIIENNVVTNVCLWDGNVESWTPPYNSIQLVQATTPSITWDINSDKTDWILVESVGYGGIGFSWDGTAVTTNEPKPPVPKPAIQPSTNGTQSA